VNERMSLLRLALTCDLLRDFPAPPGMSALQALQFDLLDVVRRSRECDERVALAFREFLIEVASREGARNL
jgi:hypothetical protein